MIVTWGTPSTLAARRATTRIPIVLGAIGDVVNTGIVASLAGPDGNITGSASIDAGLEEKRLERLEEMRTGWPRSSG